MAKPDIEQEWTDKPVAANGVKARTKFASRKFTLAMLMVVLSYLLAWFQPDMMTGQILFNFWMVVLGLYCGGNVGEILASRKKEQ